MSFLKNPGIIVAEVKMKRSKANFSILLVEGKDDKIFFLTRTHSELEIVDANGKINLLAAMTLFDEKGFVGILGVYDDDCDSLDGKAVSSPNLVRTETRDMEGILLRSGALNSVLAEHANDTVHVPKEAVILQQLLDLAMPFGLLRWLNTKKMFGLKFDGVQDGLKPVRFLNPDWTKKKPSLFSVVATMCQKTEHEIDLEISQLPSVDPWLVCQGHDLVAILGLGLGSNGWLGHNKMVTVATIAGLLRSGLQDERWRKTELYANIRQWEANNAGYLILKIA